VLVFEQQGYAFFRSNLKWLRERVDDPRFNLRSEIPLTPERKNTNEIRSKMMRQVGAAAQKLVLLADSARPREVHWAFDRTGVHFQIALENGRGEAADGYASRLEGIFGPVYLRKVEVGDIGSPESAQFGVANVVLEHDIQRVLELLRDLVGNDCKLHGLGGVGMGAALSYRSRLRAVKSAEQYRIQLPATLM
jgi:hypothetical protein